MEHVTIPGSDLKVSPLCVGCWQFNGAEMTADKTWEAQPEEVSFKIVDKAIEMGVNFFDTAEAYKNSEVVLGKALAGRRKNVVVASKFGYGPGDVKSGYGPEHIEQALTRTLQNLQTDYLDLYQAHWGAVFGDMEACVKELKRQQSLGRIRYYGVSNHGVQNMTAVMNAGGQPLTNQLCYNLLARTVENEILPFCHKNNLSILAYSPLQQGLLSGRFLKVDDVPIGRRRTRHFSMDSCSLSRHGGKGCETELFEAINTVKNICDKEGIVMSAASLSWVLQQEGVSCAIVGARSPEQLEQNCQMVKLSKEVLNQLSDSTEAVKKALGSAADLWGSDAENRIC